MELIPNVQITHLTDDGGDVKYIISEANGSRRFLTDIEHALLLTNPERVQLGDAPVVEPTPEPPAPEPVEPPVPPPPPPSLGI